MGLLYIFPISKEEKGQVKIITNGPKLVLKTYPPPTIFYLYLIVVIITFSFFFLALKSPLQSIFNANDDLNKIIATMTCLLLGGIPLGLLSLFFYQKKITKEKQQLIIKHSLFGIQIKKKLIRLKESNPFFVRHHLKSPNIARKQNLPDNKAFYNRGYFEICAIDDHGSEIFIDRHTSKTDLDKFQDFLNQY